MAIQRLTNGQFQVTSLKQAKEALLAVKALDVEIKDLQREHGILEMMDDSTELKKAATRWAADNDKERIELGDGKYVLLRRDKYGGQWISTDDDMTEGVPASATPLRAILKKKFKTKPEMFKEVWMRVTKRSVDVEELTRAVNDGVLTADEIAPAFFEKEKAPFLRFYGD